MKKKHKPKNTVVSLLKQIDQHLENIAQLTSEAARSEAMLAYLDSCARFYKYSDHNLFLINLQKPDATRVAGYKKWLEFNRYVRRGEHGIAILAPCIYRLNKQPDNDDDDTIQVTELRGFRVVYVFDITQTDGDPLPPQPDWKSPARNEELQAKLIAFAAEHNITISVVKQRGAIQGRSIGGAIELDPTAGTKTLIHEIAHELLDHHNSYTDRKTKELEAECVAYVVATHFGLPTNCPNYLAFWDADPEKITARAANIRKTASKIITSLEDSNNVHFS